MAGFDVQMLVANATAQAAQGGRKPGAASVKARAQAEDFESMFLSSMVQHMFSGSDGDGPLGKSAGVWRSFLTDAYAKTMVKAGGIGLADQVYGSLLAQQEARAK